MFTTSFERQNIIRHDDVTITRSQLTAEGKARVGMICHSVEEESYAKDMSSVFT